LCVAGYLRGVNQLWRAYGASIELFSVDPLNGTKTELANTSITNLLAELPVLETQANGANLGLQLADGTQVQFGSTARAATFLYSLAVQQMQATSFVTDNYNLDMRWLSTVDQPLLDEADYWSERAAAEASVYPERTIEDNTQASLALRIAAEAPSSRQDMSVTIHNAQTGGRGEPGALLRAPPERNYVGLHTSIDQRVVGYLDAGLQTVRQEMQFSLCLVVVRHRLGERYAAHINQLAISRPRLTWVSGLVARIGKLRHQVESNLLLCQTPRQFLDQEVGRHLGRRGGRYVLGPGDRCDLETERLLLILGVDEDEGVDTVVGFTRKA
jgi:hypothetical protein